MTRTTCRVCDSPLEVYLDLGETPLANALPQQRGMEEPRYPLQLARCATCDLSQLTVTVPPQVMYQEYPYLSGVNPTWAAHCQQAIAAHPATEKNQVAIDIGSNDGTMLTAMQEAGYWPVGVEPCSSLNNLHKHQTITGFWSKQVAEQAVHYGAAYLITAMNVLGHVDDPVDFLTNCRLALAPQGRIMVEVPRLDALIESGYWDTIYHEHLNYWTLCALVQAGARAGLGVAGFQQIPEHGGSYRVWFQIGGVHLVPPAPIDYGAFAERVNQHRHLLSDALLRVGKINLFGFGAAAKGSTLLNSLPHAPPIEAIIDETPQKQGRYLPGLGIPIVPPGEALGRADLLLVLAWNWYDTITARAREGGFRGFFLHPHQL